MNRRILYIILGGLLFLALVGGLWFWFFARGASQVTNNSGLFGSSGDRTTAGTGASGTGNGQAPVGSTAGTGVSGTSGGNNTQTPISNINTGGGAPALYYSSFSSSTATLSGAQWLGGSSGSGAPFTPTPINALNNGNVSGTPYIGVNSSDGTAKGKQSSLLTGLLGVAGSCAANYLAAQAAPAVTSALKNLFGSALSITSKVQTTDSGTQTNVATNGIMTCIVQGLARAAIQQITNDTVNWINSGFNGKPAYVTDFNKFFSDVSDQAAGSVIQGGDLAFLCSPFQLQVRVAIAQSYARRNNAPTCSLNGVVGNIEQFANGDFSQGGWAGLLSFTTDPTNNPYGAYMYGQSLVSTQISLDTQNAKYTISPEGFLAQQKCTTLPTPGAKPVCTIQTPGSVIASDLAQVTGADLSSLNLASSIDQIMNALVNQLVSKTFSGGLASLGNTQNSSASLSSEDIQAEGDANNLLNTIQGDVANAQQYGATEQGSIVDIQTAQGNLNTLESCWAGKTSGSAAANAQAAADAIAQFENQIAVYNSNIVNANSAITTLQDLQTQALNATSLADVQAASAAYDQVKAGGSLITAAEATSAQQDRTTLQAQMDTLNADTNAKLQQCYAAS